MNLANKITFARIGMIPIFMIVLLTNWIDNPSKQYIATAIFIIASLTDALDGYIARSRNLITNLGKFIDPLADKLLVTAAFIGLVELGWLPAWVVIVIISREFIITGFRVVAASNGIVIAASGWGKIKTIFQMLTIIILLIHVPNDLYAMIESIFVGLSVIFTIISGIDYIAKNKQVLIEDKGL